MKNDPNAHKDDFTPTAAERVIGLIPKILLGAIAVLLSTATIVGIFPTIIPRQDVDAVVVSIAIISILSPFALVIVSVLVALITRIYR